jgi:hypothetical protein
MIEHFDVVISLIGALAVTAAVVFLLASRPVRRKDRRGAPRVEPPPDCAIVAIEGAAFPLKNWSATGFVADPYRGRLAVGQKCVVSITVRQEPFDIAFAAEALVVRRGAAGLAARFVFPPPDNKGQIDAYFTYHAQMR